ncbi:E3 ubiquitin-protein ligase UPL7 [Chlorella vulgaris]
MSVLALLGVIRERLAIVARAETARRASIRWNRQQQCKIQSPLRSCGPTFHDSSRATARIEAVKAVRAKFLPPHWPSIEQIVASDCWGSTIGSLGQPMSYSGFQVKATGKAREQSSAEVLRQAKQERAARQCERQRQRAATTVARWWRGYLVRRLTRQLLQQDWLQQFGGLVAQQRQFLPAVDIASRVLPPVLLAYLPAASQQQQRAALLSGAPLPAALIADSRALRGCFALLLRSLASADPQLNLLGLAAGTPGQHQEQQRQRLLAQLKRLALLCCSLVGSDHTSGGAAGADGLLQAAAGRLLGILCDVSLLKCSYPNQAPHSQQRQPAQEDQQWLQEHVLPWIAQLPILRAAAMRLAQESAPDGSAQPPHQKQQQQQQQQQQQLAAVLNALVTAQLKLWHQLQGQGSDDQLSNGASDQLLHLLATPGLQPLLSPSTVAQLTASPGFVALLESAATWQPASSEGLQLLGVLAQLAAGKKVSWAQGGKACGDYLPPSQLLQQDGVAVAFSAASLALLQPCFEAPLSSNPNVGTSSNSKGSSGAAGFEHLWPFAEGTLAAQLLVTLPLSQAVRLYHQLLLLADHAGDKAQSARLLSALAFGTQLLPRLWRHLAIGVGLPLDAPLQATRGWEVATLRHGVAGLLPEAAAQLGLFCRVYGHQLLVVDDFEFYDKQQTFTLGQQRAIAAVLNTLVFRTQLPDSNSGGGGGTAKRGASLGRDYEMLQHSAPLLHRALYERDTRRPFCPPSLWLEPYNRLMSAGGQQQPLSGAAVVRALLAAADDGEGEGGARQQGRLPAAARAAAAAATAASRPAAVAAILTAAPQSGYHLSPVDGGARPVPLTIRREHEAGIDMGGLMKEFLESVITAGFDPNRGLFKATPDGCAYPNPLAERLDGGLAALETMGLVLGRALYEGVLLDLPLAPFFVSRMQGRWPPFEELAALDPEVYRSLLQLKRYEGRVEDLTLDFTVESDFLGSTVSEELVAGGSRIAVTNENVLQYVFLVADWHLNKRLGPASQAFSRGLSRVIPASWLRLFSPGEVNQLLGGGDAAGLDVDDMQAHAQYSNGYSASSTTIKHFWTVVRSLSQDDQSALLKFVTSCRRAPLGGFQHLNPPFTIHKVDCGASLLASVGGKDVDRLPTASTCSNLLKLPNFRRTATLREKLLYAIKAGAGFELS